MKNKFAIKAIDNHFVTPIFFIALLFLLVFITSSGVGGGHDIWWHIQLGENIFETGNIAADDTFSYTAYGNPQRNQEWLGDLIIFLSHKFGGFTGLYLMKSFLLCIMAFFLFFHLSGLSSQGNGKYRYHSALIAVALIIIAIYFRTALVRPLLFSFAFVSIYLFILGKSMEKKSFRLLLLLPVAQLFWTNMSAGAVVFGPLIFAGYSLSFIIQKTHKVRNLIFVGLLVVIVTLINPDGSRLFTILFNRFNPLSAKEDPATLEMIKYANEHMPLIELVMSPQGDAVFFALSLLVIAIFQILFFKGYKQGHRVILMSIVLMAAFGQSRLLGFCVLISAEAICDFFNVLINFFARLKFLKKSIVMNGIVITLMFYLLFMSFNKTKFVGLVEDKSGVFPDEAINFIRKSDFSGNMFNDYSLGGYLIRHMPERKVFIDGRANAVYVNGTLFKQFMGMLSNPEQWDAGVKRWGISYALFYYNITRIRINERNTADTFPTHLESNPKWALVYWDWRSVVYVKRNSVTQEFLKKYEYKFVQPSLSHYKKINKLKNEKTDYLSALSMIDREIALNANNQEPKIAKAMLLLNDSSEKSKREVLYQLEKSLFILPDLAFEHALYAKLLIDFGRIDEAKKQINLALELNPRNALANNLLKEINNRR